MLTLMLFAAAFVINELGRALIEDVKLAMKRSNLSLDYVARVTNTPISRLSDQLNGKDPFTAFCRFYASDELRDKTMFWQEFQPLQDARINRLCLAVDLGALLTKVEALTALVGARPKVMARAGLPVARKARVS